MKTETCAYGPLMASLQTFLQNLRETIFGTESTPMVPNNKLFNNSYTNITIKQEQVEKQTQDFCKHVNIKKEVYIKCEAVEPNEKESKTYSETIVKNEELIIKDDFYSEESSENELNLDNENSESLSDPDDIFDAEESDSSSTSSMSDEFIFDDLNSSTNIDNSDTDEGINDDDDTERLNDNLENQRHKVLTISKKIKKDLNLYFTRFPKNSTNSEKSVLHYCEICDFECYLISDLVKHKRNHRSIKKEGKHKCPRCVYTTENYEYFVVHMDIKHHNGSITYLCNQCEFYSLYLSRIKTHIRHRHLGATK